MATQTKSDSATRADAAYYAVGVIHGGLLTLLDLMQDSEAYLEGLLDGRARSFGESLTDAERQVAVALARRVSRQEIANQRVVSLSTLEKQIPQAMAKLGFKDCREFQGWFEGIRRGWPGRSGLNPHEK